MSVRVEILLAEDENGPHVVLSADAPQDTWSLEHETDVGAGVHLTVDLAQPEHWRRVSIPVWSSAALPVLSAIIGRRAVKKLKDTVRRWPAGDPLPLTGDRLEIDPSGAGPWLRLAVLHALDRWLQLPVDQALLHAEKSVVMFRAALGLPKDADAHESIMNEALNWGRRASDGVVEFLSGLAAERDPVPSALRRAMENMIDGYGGLRGLVAGPDAALSAVIATWEAIAGRLSQGNGHGLAHRHDIPKTHPTGRVAVRLPHMIDPRHVRARVFTMGEQERANDIALFRTRADGQEAVRIRVAAFKPRIDPEIAQRLMARLVDRKSGVPHSLAPLTVSTAPGALTNVRFFECTMPLGDSALDGLRADVFDAYLLSPLSHDGAEEEVLRARRAVLTLRQRRRVLAHEGSDGAADGPGRPLLAELAAAYQDPAA